MFQLAWGLKVSPTFRAKVIEICRGYGWTNEHASWLMSCIAFESGETFSPYIKNAAGSGAVGLIQFMPATAQGLGTTSEALAGMSAIEQLDYVNKYFKPYAGRVHNLPDMYLAILMPKYVGQSNDMPIFSGGAQYRQNSGLDSNRDGVVTKGEAAKKVSEKLIKGMGLHTVEPDVK